MYRNGERMMAWIAKIDKVVKHPDADSLDICTVGGWQCVTSLGEFKQGELVVYVSVDAWIPHALAPFLSKGQEPREFNGVKGERLRTVKLRGALSQGLLLPIKTGIGGYPFIKNSLGEQVVVCEGDDVSELLGIQKYEPPIPAQLAGLIRGNFPAQGRKTDQERIQNMYQDVKDLDIEYEVSEKLDGSSMSVLWIDGEFHVCSRNLSIKLEDENNSMVKVARRYGVQEAMDKLARNIQISGEIIGEGIQGNKYNIKGQDWYVFDVYDIDQGRHLTPKERWDLLGSHFANLGQVPHIGTSKIGADLESILKAAEGKSLLNLKTEREGLVFKAMDRDLSWKVISNKWLLKGGE